MKKLILPFLTLLLIICGAAMPFAASALQDSQAGKLVASRQFSPVSLTLRQNQDIVNVLQMMPREFDWYSYDGITNLSVEAARAEALDCVNELLSMPINTNSEMETELGMAVFGDNRDSSAILWLFSFQNGPFADFVSIDIDDASGKMVKLVVIYSENNNPFFTNNEYEYIESSNNEMQVAVTRRISIENWQIFCQNYYDINIIAVEENYGNYYWQYIFKYQQAGSDEVHDLSLTFSADAIVFN